MRYAVEVFDNDGTTVIQSERISLDGVTAGLWLTTQMREASPAQRLVIYVLGDTDPLPAGWPSYSATAPKASAGALGVIRVGAGLAIDADGVLKVTGVITPPPPPPPPTDSITITNPSFEVPVMGSGGYGTPTGDGVGWVFLGSAGITDKGGVLIGSNPPIGNQAGFIYHDATIQQDIAMPDDGNVVITFFAAQRNDGSINVITVTIDGVSVGTFQPANSAFQSFDTTSKALTAGTHTVAFTGNSNGGDNSSVIDSVSANYV